MIRLERLRKRMTDTHMALGSDLMTNALVGYAVLKVAGKGEGLDQQRGQNKGCREHVRSKRQCSLTPLFGAAEVEEAVAVG